MSLLLDSSALLPGLVVRRRECSASVARLDTRVSQAGREGLSCLNVTSNRVARFAMLLQTQEGQYRC
jgi:hypothetical protein